MAIRIRELFDHRRTPETAFVLGGGGNLGAIQVGQLRAMTERGIVPDVVIGCSVGALNAAAVAGNPTIQEVDRLVDLWANLTRNDVFPTSRMSRGPWLFVRNGLSAYSSTAGFASAPSRKRRSRCGSSRPRCKPGWSTGSTAAT